MFKAVVSSVGLATVAAVVVVGTPAASEANILVQFTENTVTNQVNAVVTGSLDPALFGTRTSAQFATAPQIRPSLVFSATPFSAFADSYTIGNFFVPFGTVQTNFAGTWTGPDIFYVVENGANDQLRVPQNYVANTPINASLLITGQTYATMNITPSTVVMNLPGSQTVTMQFASIPAPGAAALLGMGGVVAVGGRRRRR